MFAFPARIGSCSVSFRFAAASLAALAIAGIGSSRLCAESPERPNLILILADDLGYGDVGCYGAPDIQTPAIDALAAEGMRFTQMRANCTVCSPTRAAILSGRFADRVGVPGVIRTHPQSDFGFFDPSISTIADRLGAGGYHTGIVGKWHLGLESPNTPNERGFDHFHGFLGDMMDDYYTHLRGGLNFMRLNDQTIQPEGHASDLFTDWSINYVTERSKSDQPFFLYLAYNAPHFPIQPPDDYLRRVEQRLPETAPDRQKNIALVEHLDDCVGRLMKHLQNIGIDDHTVVAFTSDNGGSLSHAQRNLPWRDGKQSHYDGGLKVPFAMRAPGRIPSGSTCDYQGLTFDITATFLQYAGLADDEQSDAVSLMPALRNEPMPNERTLYFVRREGNRRYGGQAYHAVVRGPWKLMQNDPFSPLELYHLESDPAETNDVIRKHPKVVTPLVNAMRDQIQAGGRTPWQRPDSTRP